MKWFANILISAGLFLLVSGLQSNAGDYYWANTAGGSFTNSGNWNPAGSPGSADNVYFVSNGVYTTIFPVSWTNHDAHFNAVNGGNVTLDIGSGNTWSLTDYLSVSDNAGRTNSLTQISGNLTVPNNVTAVGNSGNGTMTISNGLAQLQAVYVGYYSGSVGNWNIAGGTNTVSSYLSAGQNAGSTGTILMTGGNLTVTNIGTYFGNVGNGTMTISNGLAQFQIVYVGYGSGSVGTWNIAGGTNSLTSILYISELSGSTGKVLMTGGNLTVTNNSTIVGNSGKNGTMTISNGLAQFQSIYVGNNSGSVGTWNIAGGTNTASTYLAAGQFAGSTGTILMTGGNLTVTNNATYIGNVGNGTMTISNGLAQFQAIYVGNNSGSVGTWNIAGGTNTASSLVTIGQVSGSTGTVLMTGGNLTVPNNATYVGGYGNGTITISNGVAQLQVVYVGYWSGSVGNWNIAGGTNTLSSSLNVAQNSGATGTVTVTGTKAVITCSAYTHNTAGATLKEQFFNGGVSPIKSSGAATLNGTLTLGFNGYMALISSDAMPLIKASSFTGNFVTTNRSVFAVSKTSTQLLATADSPYKVTGNVLGNGAATSVSATNMGWFAANTNGMAGPSFNLYLRVLTNNAAHTVSQLASAMQAAGHTVTNRVIYGEDWLTLTLPVPAWTNPAFAWDLTGYDANLAVDQIWFGVFPYRGTVFHMR